MSLIGQSQFTSRVALAPFAPAVNVEYFALITGRADLEDPDGDGYTYPSTCYKSSGKLKSSCSDNSYQYMAKQARCVVERTGAEQATDTAPTGAGTWLPTWNNATQSNSKNCTPSAKIVPLTKDRTLLKDTIDGFKASGATAGQLGTAFAWYLLSPNWNNVWPAGRQPTNYGTPKVQKIAILMTDGIYKTLQGESYGDYSSQATQAANQAIATCTGMKQKGITIYSVLFELDGVPGADKALKSCASTTDKFYNAANGDQLKAAFRDIALKISKLRLTN